jgi:hypothetical protein
MEVLRSQPGVDPGRVGLLGIGSRPDAGRLRQDTSLPGAHRAWIPPHAHCLARQPVTTAAFRYLIADYGLPGM